MPTEEEKERVIRELETPEERAEREAAGLDKPRKGRPPGSKNKVKMSDETLEAGCVSFVKFMWLLSRGGAWMVGGELAPPLTDEEVKEGAAEAKNLLARFSFFVIVLSIIGFPVWLFGKVASRFKRREPAPKLSLVKPEGSAEENATGE